MVEEARGLIDFLRDDGAMSVEVTVPMVDEKGFTEALHIKAVFQRPRHLTTAVLGVEAQGHKQEKAERDKPGEPMAAPDLRYWSAR